MQQFNSTFIDHHLIPLLQVMLIDAAKDAKKPVQTKPYFIHLIADGYLTGIEKNLLKKDYFLNNPHDTKIPFRGNDQEINQFIDYFEGFVKAISSDPESRWKFLIPIEDQQTPDSYVWPAVVEQNIYLMAYDIAHKFEKKQIEEMLKAKESRPDANFVEIAKDKALNEKGLLVLVKYADGTWQYITKEQAQKLGSAIQFISPPSLYGKKALRPTSLTRHPSLLPGHDTSLIKDHISSHEEIAQDSQLRRAQGLKQTLTQLGFQPEGEVRIENGIAMIKVASGDEIVEVSVNIEIPADQDLNYVFKFTDRDNIIHEISSTEGQLQGLFTDQDGKQRPIAAAYQNYNASSAQGQMVTPYTAVPKIDDHRPSPFSINAGQRRRDAHPRKDRVTYKVQVDLNVPPSPPVSSEITPTEEEKNKALRMTQDKFKIPKPVSFRMFPKRTALSIQQKKRNLRTQKKIPLNAPKTQSSPQPLSPYQPLQSQPQSQIEVTQTTSKRNPDNMGKKILWAAGLGAAGVGGAVGGGSVLLTVLGIG